MEIPDEVWMSLFLSGFLSIQFGSVVFSHLSFSFVISLSLRSSNTSDVASNEFTYLILRRPKKLSLVRVQRVGHALSIFIFDLGRYKWGIL